MAKKKNKKQINIDKNMSSDFVDSMSRREQHRIKKEKEKQKKEIDIKENIEFDRMLKQKRELQEKLDKNEVQVKVKVHKTNLDKKKEKSAGTTLFFMFIVVCALAYLAYSVYIAFNKVDYVYTIINASIITLTIILFAITGLLKNNKARKVGNVLTGMAFMSILAFNVCTSLEFFVLPTQPIVIDLTTKTVNEAIKWASENKIELVETKEFSDTTSENGIISQSVEPYTLLKKVKKIEIVSSSGPNPESSLNIQDMIGWDVDKVVKEIKKLKLTNVNIIFEFSTIDRDTLFEQSKTGKIHRNEELILKFSLGNEEDLAPVKLIDLVKKDEFDATLWLKRNGIKYEIKYEFSDSVSKGKVISTNPKQGTTINQREQNVTLVISKGPKIIVPDLLNMSMDEIAEWAIKNNINITYNSEFDSNVKKGKIKAVSHKKGDVIEEGNTIYITTSKGTLRMIDYNENDLAKIRTFANTYKINLLEAEEYSDSVEKGKIISVSHKKGDVLNTGDTLEVKISLGNSIQVPDFYGMNVNEAKNLCSSKNLDCSIVYVKSTSAKNTVVKQNKRAGSEVIDGTNVVLSVSNGIAPSTGSNSGNNNKPSGGGSSSSGGGNNSGGNTTPSCDRSKTVTVYLNPTIGDANATARNLDSRVHWNVVYVSRANYSESASIGMITAGDIAKYDGKNLNMCDTYTIHIFNS